MQLTSRVVLFSALAAAACDQQTPPLPAQPVAAPAEQRLLDRLDSARVEAPARAGIEPGDSLVRLRLDFDGSDPSRIIGVPSRVARIVQSGGDAGRVLRLTPTRRRPPGLLLRIEPDRFVRIERAVRGDTRIADLVVIEMRVEPRHDEPHPADLDRALTRHSMAGSFVQLDALVRQHRFPAAVATDSWRQDAIELTTAPETRSLLLVFQTWPASGSAATVDLDRIRVTELDPSPAERLGLARRRLGIAPDAELLAASGRFLKLPEARGATSDRDGAFETRTGLLVPTPTSVTWTIDIQPHATLHLGLGLARESPPGSSALCRVTAGAETLLEATLTGAQRKQWQDEVLPLDRVAGAGVELTLGCEADAPGTIPVFSNPIVSRPRAHDDPPPVFLIAVDTLRADRLSTYGHDRQTSPNLQRLAADAVIFDNAVAQSNWTPESFASVFTSSYSGQHGVTERLTVLRHNDLAAAMRDAGYFTQGIAYKLLLYDMGFERGFDAYFNVPRFHLSKGYDIHAGLNWRRIEPWLEANGNRQVFLFAHLNDPHQPFNQRGEAAGRFVPSQKLAARGLSLPLLIKRHTVKSGPDGTRCTMCAPKNHFAPWFTQLASDLYDEEVLYTDAYVGRFLDALEELGIYDESVVVFLSDHGEGLGEHEDQIGHGFHHMQDSLVRVPLIIKPPAAAGITPRRVPAQVRLLDVLPTLLELAGVPAAPAARGSSLLPLMRGDEEQDERVAIGENVETRTIAVRAAGHKYVLRYGRDRPIERLYDLTADPAEQHDVSNDKDKRRVLADARATAGRHLATTHGGSFVLITGDARAPQVDVRISKPDATLEPIVGRVTKRRGGRWQLALEPGELRAAFRVVAAEQSTVALTSGDAMAELGALSSWPEQDAGVELGGLRVIRTRRTAAAAETKASVGGDELEALQALGYVGN